MSYAFLNGKYLPISQAKISITDVAVLRGYAIFDSLAAVNSRVVDVDQHLKRFRNSAKLLGLRCPYTNAEIKKILVKLLNKNKFKKSRVKIVLSGGQVVNNIEFNPAKPTFFITNEPAPEVSPTIFTKGVSLVSLEHQRELAEAKTINYITAVQHQIWRKQKRAFEILYKYNSKALECTTSNFFIIKGKKVITPKKNVLAGITRAHTIRVAKKFYKVEEREVPWTEVKKADEAFITATYKDVIPVVKIDNFKIGSGQVGPVTKHLMSLYPKNYTPSK